MNGKVYIIRRGIVVWAMKPDCNCFELCERQSELIPWSSAFSYVPQPAFSFGCKTILQNPNKKQGLLTQLLYWN